MSSELEHMHESIPQSIECVVFDLVSELGNVSYLDRIVGHVVVELMNETLARMIDEHSRSSKRRSELIGHKACVSVLEERGDQVHTVTPVLLSLGKCPTAYVVDGDFDRRFRIRGISKRHVKVITIRLFATFKYPDVLSEGSKRLIVLTPNTNLIPRCYLELNSCQRVGVAPVERYVVRPRRVELHLTNVLGDVPLRVDLAYK